MKAFITLLIIGLIAAAGKLSFSFFLSNHYLASGICTALCLFGISFVIISFKPLETEETKTEK